MYRFYPFLSFFFDWMNFLLRVMASWSPSFSNNPKVAQLPPGVHPNTIFGWTTCISKTPRLRSFVEVVRSRVENDRGTAKGWNGSDTCTLSFNIPNQMYCTSLLLVYHYNHLAFFYASMYIYIYHYQIPIYSKPSHISCVFPHMIPINHEQQNSKIARLASRMGFTLFCGQCSRRLRLLLLRCKRQLIQRKPGVWNSKIHSMLTL